MNKEKIVRILMVAIVLSRKRTKQESREKQQRYKEPIQKKKKKRTVSM